MFHITCSVRNVAQQRVDERTVEMSGDKSQKSALRLPDVVCGSGQCPNSTGSWKLACFLLEKVLDRLPKGLACCNCVCLSGREEMTSQADGRRTHQVLSLELNSRHVNEGMLVGIAIVVRILLRFRGKFMRKRRRFGPNNVSL